MAVPVALALAGCAGPGGAGDPDAETPIAVSEVLTAPATDPDGLAFSVALRNNRDRPVSVSEVSAVADDGVTVEILGASTCREGCAGAMNWHDAQPMMARSIEYPDAFPVPPADEVLSGRADVIKVVLHVYPADAAALRRLEDGCLFVRQLLVRVGDGELQPARNDHGDFGVALDRSDAGLPGVPQGCVDQDET
jgi:hypothetical protein